MKERHIQIFFQFLGCFIFIACSQRSKVNKTNGVNDSVPPAVEAMISLQKSHPRPCDELALINEPCFNAQCPQSTYFRTMRLGGVGNGAQIISIQKACGKYFLNLKFLEGRFGAFRFFEAKNHTVIDYRTYQCLIDSEYAFKIVSFVSAFPFDSFRKVMERTHFDKYSLTLEKTGEFLQNSSPDEAKNHISVNQLDSFLLSIYVSMKRD